MQYAAIAPRCSIRRLALSDNPIDVLVSKTLQDAPYCPDSVLKSARAQSGEWVQFGSRMPMNERRGLGAVLSNRRVSQQVQQVLVIAINSCTSDGMQRTLM